MINNDVILISDHTMIIDQSWYWPTFSPLHGNNSFPMRWSSPLIWQKHWHCIDDSWGPVPADLIIMTLTYHRMITITTWPIRSSQSLCAYHWIITITAFTEGYHGFERFWTSVGQRSFLKRQIWSKNGWGPFSPPKAPNLCRSVALCF